MRPSDVVLVWAHRVLALVVLVVAAGVLWGGGPAGSRDPVGSQADAFIGVIQSVAIAPGLVVSLVVNSVMLQRHGARGLTRTERVLVLVDVAVIAFLQLGVLFDLTGLGGLRLLGWVAAIVLAVLIFTRAVARNRAAAGVVPS